jgi:hypothetical protein
MTHSRVFNLKFLAVAALALAGSSAFADTHTVGGNIPPINALTFSPIDATVAAGAFTAAAGNSAFDLGTGQIDNNSVTGWKLEIKSLNKGVLKRTSAGGGSGAGSEVLYSNIKLINTGGTNATGTGISDPAGATGTAKDVTNTSGIAVWNTGSAVGTPGTAATATVGYKYKLQINIGTDTSRLAGTYTDSLTLTLANDS